jgi:hypothetical protein
MGPEVCGMGLFKPNGQRFMIKPNGQRFRGMVLFKPNGQRFSFKPNGQRFRGEGHGPCVFGLKACLSQTVRARAACKDHGLSGISQAIFSTSFLY